MNKTVLKSIAAIVAGFALGTVLSVVADLLLANVGVMSMENFKENSPSIIFLVIVYRFVSNIIGCYLTAKLAPDNVMKHVIIMGLIGTILSIAASFAMWDKAVAWYNISIILISLPSAWLAGRLYLLRNKN